ncbi:hypothetical protein DFP72DRAFT_1053694 [Ephemerocybe angulata]|uniref:Tetrapyrrole methylase domain-containing protein n=1 Tax=Ephemerocybe angulata TaxID=980116 RepID=A0A8H6HAT1_9AGAR|nr:hypothetical protein DFP72DRAFT_1053694 [Tulosesus angulatus]
MLEYPYLSQRASLVLAFRPQKSASTSAAHPDEILARTLPRSYLPQPPPPSAMPDIYAHSRKKGTSQLRSPLKVRVPKTPLMTLALPPTHNLPNSKCGWIFFIRPSSRRRRKWSPRPSLTSLSDRLVFALITSQSEKVPGQRGATQRLKQGGPAVYGRAGEEVLYFRAHRLDPLVIPGISSALAASTFKFANLNIPVTQRRAAGSFTVCTGVRRGGKEITLQPSRLVRARAHLGNPPRPGRRRGALWLRTRGRGGRALESSGEQRPPGMIVVGWAVLCLNGKGDRGSCRRALGRGMRGGWRGGWRVGCGGSRRGSIRVGSC